MNKIFTSLLFILCLAKSSVLFAQTNTALWSQVGLIDNKYTVTSIEYRGNQLYAGLYSSIDSGSVIAKWNGLFWTYYPSIKGFLKNNNSYEIFNDTLYALYTDYSGGAAKTKFIRFSGTAWQTIPVKFTALNDSFSSQLAGIKSINNTLYIFGYLLDSTGTEVGILKYVNNTLKPEGPPIKAGVKGAIRDLSLYKGRLLLHGSTQRPTRAQSDSTTRSVNLMWDGSKWLTHDNFIDSNTLLYNDHDTLFLEQGKAIVKFFGTTTQVINGNISDFFANTFVSINGKYYASGSFSFNGGASFIYGVVRKQANTWFIIDINNRDGMIDFNGKLTAPSPINTNVVEMLNPGLSFITGNIYKDKNTNCIKDGTDEFTSMRKVNIMPDNVFVTTNNAGNYFATVAPGTKTLTTSATFTNKYLTYSPCSTPSKTVTLNADTIVTVDLPLAEQSGVTDVTVKLFPNGTNRVRRGAYDGVTVKITNTGTTDITSGNVQLKLDPLFSINSSFPSYTSYSNNTVTWNYTNLKKDSIKSFYLELQLSSSATVGDSIKFITWVTPNPDQDLSDNADSAKCVIVYSYDPNDKQCNPPNVILASTNFLDYTIRFQNTGTSYAQNVYVVDTVDNKLPLEKISITGWSTPARPRVEVRGGNVLVFTFADIKLPDSFSNEKGSHGFISYRCGLYKNLPLGAKVTNRADIYFDYNIAVPTNQTENVQTEKVGIQNHNTTFVNDDVLVYPNPAYTILIVQSNSFRSNGISISDITGKLIETKTTEGLKPVYFNVENLEEGIYFITLKNEHEQIVKKVMIRR